MPEYYSLEPILSKKDLDGKDPFMYLISTNRSAGKTTAVLIKFLEDFRAEGKQCCFFYRNQYEIGAVSAIFKDVLNIYPHLGSYVETKSVAKGLMYQIFLDGEPFGMSVPLGNPDPIKKYSPMFADIWNILFDEFQTETGKYLSKETEKLIAVYLTIARGGGKQLRPVKLFMCANNVSIMNPYFVTLGIYKRLKSNTHFMRGNGWVAEFGFNESAASAIAESGIARAFQGDYMDFTYKQNVYLHDDKVFIQKPTGKSKYLFTIIYDGCQYGVREYWEDGFIYVSNKIDSSCKSVLSFKAGDHNQNSILISHYSNSWKYLMEAFKEGFLRFDDLKAKNAVFDILAIDAYK